MDIEFLKVAGQIAGIGGLSIGAFLILFRDVIRKNIFPNLTKEQAYSLLRLIVVLVWSIAVFGIAAWTYASTIRRNDPNSINLSHQVPQATSSIPVETEVSGQIRHGESIISGANILDVATGALTQSDKEGRFKIKTQKTTNGMIRIRATKDGFQAWEDYIDPKDGLIISLQEK